MSAPFIISEILPKLRGDFYEPSYVFIKDFPVINTSDTIIKESISNKADQLLKMNKDILSIKTPQEKTSLQRQIDARTNKIDQFVYQLYGLTEEEIKIVEGEKRIKNNTRILNLAYSGIF